MDLEKLKEELSQIEEFLAKPEAYADSEFATKSKRAMILREILDLNKNIEQMKNNLEEANSLLSDPELGEIAKEDAEKLKNELKETEAKLEELLPHNEMQGPVFKIKDDPRITRVGKFIRKTSIDELPQLLNTMILSLLSFLISAIWVILAVGKIFIRMQVLKPLPYLPKRVRGLIKFSWN